MREKIAILSGSGLSAESGLPTFRDAAGLWRQHSWQDLASPEGWRANPALVLEFYNERRARAWSAQPNAAHLAIAALERKYEVVVVTQNVDALHERAGSTTVLHVHGELSYARGTGPARQRYRIDGAPIELGQLCEEGTQLRPDIVWFGEETQFMERGARARRCRRQGPGSWDLAQRLSRGFAGRCGARRCGQGFELPGDGRGAAGLRFPSRPGHAGCCPASSRDGCARRADRAGIYTMHAHASSSR